MKMNRTCVGFLIAVLLALTSMPSSAVITIGLAIVDPAQVGQSNSATTELKVTGRSTVQNLGHLSIGAGYTLMCPSGGGTRHVEDSSTITSPGTNNHSFTIGQQSTFIGMEGWQANESHTCTADYKGLIGEGSTGISGNGSNFVFQVGSVPQKSDSAERTFVMKKASRGGTPGCNP